MHAAKASHDVLAAAMRDLQRALAPLGVTLSADDPLRLALPVVPADAAGPARDVVAAFAALYLHAELDEAGVLPVVEAVAEQRHRLALQQRATAERLERFAASSREYPSQSERSLIYARLFGLGPAATRDLQGAVQSNHWNAGDARLDFGQKLLRLATAIVRADMERTRMGGAAGLRSQAAWRAAVQDLRALVAALPAGSLVQWARRIHQRTLQAFEVLGDPGLLRQMNTQAPWQTLQKLLPEAASARADAAARRGAAGQALLRSLAATDDDAKPNASAVQAAFRWLIASGLPVPQGAPTWPASPQPIPRTAFSAAAQNPAREFADPLADDALPENIWGRDPR